MSPGASARTHRWVRELHSYSRKGTGSLPFLRETGEECEPSAPQIGPFPLEPQEVLLGCKINCLLHKARLKEAGLRMVQSVDVWPSLLSSGFIRTLMQLVEAVRSAHNKPAFSSPMGASKASTAWWLLAACSSSGLY